MELYNAIAKLDKGGDGNESVEVSLCGNEVVLCSELWLESFWGYVRMHRWVARYPLSRLFVCG